LDRLDRIVDRLGRDTNSMIEIIDQLGQQVGYYSNQSQFYRDGIARIQQNAAEEGRSLTDEEQRKIWEYEDALEGINDSLYDMVETVENSLLEEFERWNSEIDENIARFDVYSSTIEHYANIIKLSGRETKDAMLLMQLQSQRTSIAMEELNANYDKWQANL
jgi:Arc/MetJ-type ribon-helix-helix transcriptional regulator